MARASDPIASDLGASEVASVRVAVVAGRDEATYAGIDRFCRALGRIGMTAESVVLEDYSRISEALANAEVGLAWLPPIAAARVIAGGGVVPVALPVRSGVAACSSALFTRTNSSIRGIGDLRALRAAWVDTKSASGYLAIRALLHARGVNLDAAFSKSHFLGSHHAVARTVLAGEADVGATYAYPKQRGVGVRAAGWGSARVHVIAQAGPIPLDVITASRALGHGAIGRIREAFVSCGDPEVAQSARAALGAERFIDPLPEFVAPLMELVGGLGASWPANTTTRPAPLESSQDIAIDEDGWD